VLAAVETLHVAPGDSPACSGLDGMFERAGRALIRALQPEPVAVPGHSLKRAPARRERPSSAGPGADQCPARELGPTWHRAGQLTGTGPASRLSCGCDDDGPCIWAWGAEHYAAVPPGLAWSTLDHQVTDSPLLREVRALGIPEEALAATKGRPPRAEGGLWDQAVRAWGLDGPLASRVYGVPIITMVPCVRRVVDDDLRATACTEVRGYLDDIHITNTVLAGPGGQQHASAEWTRLRLWASDSRMRETAGIITLAGAWNTLLETVQAKPGGHTLVPRYDVMSFAERKLNLVADTTTVQTAAQHDADPMSLDDLALAQLANGYSDIACDMRTGVVNNGLLLGGGIGAICGQPAAQDAYRAVSRTLIAAARCRTHAPSSQVICNTLLWNAANGRHNITERAAGLDFTWLAGRWPVLDENRRAWTPVEAELAQRIYTRLGPVARPGTGPCVRCGDLPVWSRVMHDVLQAPGGACAMTSYVLCRETYGTTRHGPAEPFSPGSEFAGAVALMIKQFIHTGALYDLGWLLAGAIWFHQALHLRSCIVDLASRPEHRRLAADDWLPDQARRHVREIELSGLLASGR
jgi:hypothetical protein